MRIYQNPDKEYAAEVKQRIKENSGHCPCKLEKTPDTKCRCKEFRDQVAAGVEGECHCGLWIAELDGSEMKQPDPIDRNALLETIFDHVVSMSVCSSKDEYLGMVRMRDEILQDIYSAERISEE